MRKPTTRATTVDATNQMSANVTANKKELEKKEVAGGKEHGPRPLNEPNPFDHINSAPLGFFHHESADRATFVAACAALQRAQWLEETPSHASAKRS